MRTKDITLVASLMGIFIIINMMGALSPIKITELMASALFGLFWNYFSIKQNLSIQGLRLSHRMIRSISKIPKLIPIIQAEVIIGIKGIAIFYEWGLVIDWRHYEIIKNIGKSANFVIVFYIYLFWGIITYLFWPYCFYRYFKRAGIFRRLPSF